MTGRGPVVLFRWWPGRGEGAWLPVYVGWGPLVMSSRASARRVARTLTADDASRPAVAVFFRELPATAGECSSVLMEFGRTLAAPAPPVSAVERPEVV